MARTKRYHDQTELGHLWFHQQRDHATTRNGNFYFHEDVIYSYGSHFPIARLITLAGQKVVLFTDRSYSNTTAGHKCSVRGAIPSGTLIFYVEHVTENNILTQLKSKLKPIWENVQRCRRKCSEIEKFKDARQAVLKYQQLTKKIESAWMPPDYEAQCEKSEEYEATREVREAKKRVAREARRIENERIARLKFEERLALWQEGKCSTSLLQSSGWRDGPVYVRLMRNGTVIETSMGAIVPLQDAVNLWRIANYCRLNKLTVEHGDSGLMQFKVGGYLVSRVGPEGDVVIGCHRLQWSVMFEMAERLGIENETRDPRTPFPVATPATA